MKLENGLCLGLAFALAVACGGKSEESGSGGAGGSGATGGSGGTGGTGGSGGSGGTGGSSGGSGGMGGLSCSELAQQYGAYLAQAKGCNSLINSIQCTDLVDTELACPCSTYVNPANGEALKKLSELKVEWGAKKCMEGRGCPAIACIQPQGSACQPNGAGGDGDGCVDFGPD